MNKKMILAIPVLLLAVAGIAYAGYTAFDQLVASGHSNLVRLCYKDADGADNNPATTEDNWQCETNNVYSNKTIRGQVRSDTVNYGKYKVHVDLNGLRANTEYQLKLNSYGAGFEANALANSCPAPSTGVAWQCGYWGEEGFLVIATMTSNKNGQINTIIEHPMMRGVYETKFLVAENQAPWTTPLMETEKIQFIVI